MSDTCPAHLVTLAGRLADASASVLSQYYRTPLSVEDKADHSPVTIADREAERAIRAILAAQRPDDGVFGEEFGVSNAGAEYLWVIDPIDGTKSFVTGRPLFGTLIALLRHGRPILGVIDQPIIGDRWIGATGHATTMNGNAVSVRGCSGIATATLGTTTPDMFKGGDETAFRRVATACRMTVYGGDCYSYGLLAAGFFDLIVEADLKLYDFAALVPIVMGAGGVMTDWRGAALGAESDGRVVAAGDPRTHAEALALLCES